MLHGGGAKLRAHLPLFLLTLLQLVDQVELDLRHLAQLRLRLQARVHLRLHPLSMRLPRECALSFLLCSERFPAVVKCSAHLRTSGLLRELSVSALNGFRLAAEVRS